jgi:hypothetical protein
MIRFAVVAVSIGLAASAQAQPTFLIRDDSSERLIDKAAASAIWKAALPQARLAKLYPPAKWGFLSQVEGGILGGQTCVVTARATLLPRTSPTRRLVWEPAKMTTTFDSRPGADPAACSALAAERLKEAVDALVAGLVATK